MSDIVPMRITTYAYNILCIKLYNHFMPVILTLEVNIIISTY